MKNEQSKTKSTVDSRRIILRATLVVAGVQTVPSHWQKPLINAVITPAHAQLSFGCSSVELILVRSDVTPPSGGDAVLGLRLMSGPVI